MRVRGMNVGLDTNGTTVEKYYRDGKLHREDGPASVRRNPDGSAVEEYYLDGVKFQKDEYDAKMNPLLTALRLPLENGGQEAVDALMREAIEEQGAPGRPSGRELIPLPRCP
jgi:hypothetical protein